MSSYAFKQLREEREYTVKDAPDTADNAKRPVTVRPEKLVIKFRDGELVWAEIGGRRILKDGKVSGYTMIGFSAYLWEHRPDRLPAWVDEILRAEGLTWPGRR